MQLFVRLWTVGSPNKTCCVFGCVHSESFHITSKQLRLRYHQERAATHATQSYSVLHRKHTTISQHWSHQMSKIPYDNLLHHRSRPRILPQIKRFAAFCLFIIIDSSNSISSVTQFKLRIRSVCPWLSEIQCHR